MKTEVNTKIFNDDYIKLLNKKQRYIYIYGGASSGKSNFIAHFLVIRALAGEAILVARETQVSLRKSVYLEFKSAISDMDLNKYFKENKTELTFDSLISVGSIQMVGCDSEDRVKSIKPLKQTAFTKLLLEEVDGIPKNLVVQLNLRMRGKAIGNFSKQTYYVFNPTFEQHFLFQDFIIPLGFDPINDWYYEDDENIVMRTTYKSNRFLADDEIEYLEKLKDISEYHYKVYLLAEPGVIGDRCFDDVERVNDVPNNLPIYIGCDFGWNDKTAVSIMRVDVKNRIVYLIDGFAESHLDHIQMARKIKKLYSKHKINNGQPIYADSEDPRLIKQLSGQGLNVIKANKPQGSVLNGIMIMNTYQFKCLWKEGYESLTNYVWETDKKTGKPINKPLHNDASHIADACRYGLETLLSGYTETFGKHLKY